MLDINDLSQLCSELGCRITPDCSLSEYITFRFGGPCKALISINSAESAVRLMSYLKENGVRYGILGRGSNVIVPDEGFDGVILLFGGDFAGIEIKGTTLVCQAGALLASACVNAQHQGLTGMENLFGIPGTVGGALYMNAGAYGSEMADVVVSAEYRRGRQYPHDLKGRYGSEIPPQRFLRNRLRYHICYYGAFRGRSGSDQSCNERVYAEAQFKAAAGISQCRQHFQAS